MEPATNRDKMVHPIDLSENAVRVLEARYLRRNKETRIVETPEGMFERVARAVARAELLWGGAQAVSLWEHEFLQMMTSLDFLPNSPTLMNAGTPVGQLSACFVLPVEDSGDSVFDTLKHTSAIHRTGGGTGFSFSRFRPGADARSWSNGGPSGPVSIMSLFDFATEHIRQGGRRRGANMGVLRVDHPDIMEFIAAKRDGQALRNFNLSVAVTDNFMEAVCRGDRYPLVHPRTGSATGMLPAREVFTAIADASWRTGDPGLIFLDAVNRGNPTPQRGPIEATNPCGEVPLLPFEACNLGSINLARMVDETNQTPRFDWERFLAVTRAAVRFLDDVIEVNRYPLSEIDRAARGTRKIGLGVMGLAELLIRLGIPYDSEEARRLGEWIAEAMARQAFRASQELAEVRGVFPYWKGSRYEAANVKVRNATLTAIAPTGTIGIIAETSPSIEPIFALAYRRSHVLGGEELFELNRLFRRYLESLHTDYDSIARQVLENGSLAGVEGVPERVKRVFVTALEMPPDRHLEMQAAFQRHVDNSVAKTINMPAEASPTDVAGVFRRAWELGLKGVTVYRYGSKSQQVLELGAGEKAYHYEHASPCDPEECRV